MEITGSRQGIGGLVTLGLLPSTVDLLSSALVAAVAAQYPGIRMRIAVGYAGTLLQWLESGEIDAALLYGAERSPDVQVTPLVEEDLWVIAPATAGLRREQPVPLRQLQQQRMVLPSTPHGIRALVDHACAVKKIELDIAAETNALSVQRSLVLGGLGWTILPPIAVADDLREGRLSGAPLCQPDIARTIVLALPNQRPTGQHVRCTVDLLVREVQTSIDSGAWLESRSLKG
jgi:LysR family nitrogen assimilation transcriptional regulator